MTTSTKILIDLGQGIEAKAGSTPSSSDAASQSDLTDLVTGMGAAHKWATLEPDFWLLGGSFHIMSSGGSHIGFWSDGISGAGGTFASPPELRIDFDDDYDLDYAITFFFDDAIDIWCDDLDVDFYDSGDSLLDSQSFAPDAAFYKAEIDAVASVAYVILTFNSTNVAYRHARLTDILFDTIQFSGNEIKSAEIVEEISPVSLEAPSNSLEFSIHNDDGDFSIVSPAGIYSNLERHQRIDVYETVDGVEEYMGRFYLEEWSSENDKLARFGAVDALAILGTIPFVNSGHYFADGSVSNPRHTLSDFFTYYFNDDTGFTFDIDSSLLSEYVDGWVPLDQSCRDVLQNIGFALGAIVTCSRSSSVRILPMELAEDVVSFDFTVDDTDMANRDIKQKPIVTGIRLTSHRWQDNSASYELQIYNDSITLGSYRFFLDDDVLMIGFTKSGTSVVSTSMGFLYLDVTVTTAGTLYIYTGAGDVKRHVKEQNDYTVPGLPSGTPDNILEITDAYFVVPGNVATVAQRLIDYFDQKYGLSARLFASDISSGDSMSASTQKSGKTFEGIIEKTNIQLVGFRTDVVSRGNIV